MPSVMSLTNSSLRLNGRPNALEARGVMIDAATPSVGVVGTGLSRRLCAADHKQDATAPARPPQRIIDDIMLRHTELRAGRFAAASRVQSLSRRLEDDYDISSSVLGSGSSGNVVLGRCRRNGARVAIKQLCEKGGAAGSSDLTAEAAAERWRNEVEVFLSLDHPHIVRLVDVYETSVGARGAGVQGISLVMECLEGGELFDRLIKTIKFPELAARGAIRQMLLAVAYLHNVGVVHRDLKLENFMYSAPGLDELKLVDFGLSRFWRRGDPCMNAVCGSSPYCAPEVFEGRHTSQCDLWSLGVVAFILLSGHVPFPGDKLLQTRAIKSGCYKMTGPRWTDVSMLAQEFVMRLLVVDPNCRLNAKTALAHPWVERCYHTGSLGTFVDRPLLDSLKSFARSSRFKRTCLSVMARSTTGMTRATTRDAFLELDVLREGSIQIGHLRRKLVSEFQMSAIDADDVVAALDSRGLGDVHYTDFLAATSFDTVPNDNLIWEAFNRIGSTDEFWSAAFADMVGTGGSASCELFPCLSAASPPVVGKSLASAKVGMACSVVAFAPQLRACKRRAGSMDSWSRCVRARIEI
eukprot:TRINITY_DN15721_c0_g1_i9.p1 TRINITY_DN15721_c0_g1~~TRINITY_DN15721_c0_g1_i9.p1  ORF type:complete len:587 (+),score=90.22 TRINITY_DN15721_c0_g1_i9:24-1763(+)